jgi:hypothetical protein
MPVRPTAFRFGQELNTCSPIGARYWMIQPFASPAQPMASAMSLQRRCTNAPPSFSTSAWIGASES